MGEVLDFCLKNSIVLLEKPRGKKFSSVSPVFSEFSFS